MTWFCGLIGGMEPVNMIKKRRKAVWRECLWCRARGIDPPCRMGKLKPLERHMVECEAAYRLEQEGQQRPKVDVILAMVKRQQSQIAELSARLVVLEQKKVRAIDPTNYWDTLPARQCWRNRKQNCKRIMEAILSRYEPAPYHNDHWSWFSWFFPPESVSIQDILMAALWPIVEERDEKKCLRGIGTEDLYHIFKQIWGKQRVEGADLDWFIDCMDELGAPYDRCVIQKEAAEFHRALMKFQGTKKKAGTAGVCQGLVPLVRIWRRLAVLDDPILTAARSLPPGKALKWDIPAPSDPSPSESTEVHADNKSDLELQSSSDIPQGYVGVHFS
jgi:hypothetical protein